MSYLLDPFNWDLTDPQSIPNLLFAHLYICGISLGIALLIAFPVAFLLVRYERLYTPVITVATILYTIPGLAAMALLLPVFRLTPPEVIIPLIAYAQIVLLRNIVAGIRGVDPTLVDVGYAMGMSQTQVLWRVTVPLALPVIIAGLRVAVVTTIGIATLGSLFGVPDLGTLIFQNGISINHYNAVVAGAILIGGMAILADLLLLLIQRLLSRGREIGFAA